MACLTLTYDQRDALALERKLHILQTHFTEIHSKKCLSVIPGLVSRSFQVPNEHQATLLGQSLFEKCPVWIKYGSKSVDDSELPGNTISNKAGELSEISLGYLSSNLVYNYNKGLRTRLVLQWHSNAHQKIITVKLLTSPSCEMEIMQEYLEKYFIVSTVYDGSYMILLPLKAPPRCYQSCDRSIRRRALDFGKIISAQCLADSSVLSLKFSNRSSATDLIQFLISVLKLDRQDGPVFCQPIPAQQVPFDHILSDFWSSYAFQMLLTLGHRIKNQISLETLEKIQRLSLRSYGYSYGENECYAKLLAVYYRARYNRFLNINEEYDNIEPISSAVILARWEYVPRAYLTPYGLYPLPIKPMRSNRILRERELFGTAENFCRVIIRDVDLGLPQQDFMKANEKWFKDIILKSNQITIGDRGFDFLLCSNSQLRDRSFWLHAPYDGRNAEYIRRWMGDFSEEKCIGRRVARMAQSLTGTTATIKILPRDMERIDDILDDSRRIFTDGVGKISPGALKRALEIYNPELTKDGYIPPIIQARLNGIKGLFVVDPNLNESNIKIQYRPSQHKFETSHNVLEIVKHSTSGMAFLNRQVIFLLENMGVKQYIFLKLQNKSRLRISMSLLSSKSAQRTLEQHVRYYDWERMRLSGIQLTQEPFARSLLLLLAEDRLKRLKEKSQVPISLSDGRMLFGVADETGSLDYGQVFIQLRDMNGERTVIHDRQILITKNPAHFPGDVRKLDAVDCPALHHLDECVVFPARGKRPHSNEISGSDLDGDEYWVCWNEDLVNGATKQYEPATFDAGERANHHGEITMVQIADFLFKYLSSDSLGVLSNRHLACCAVYGPNHDHSRRLAGIISQAVDFPKTGVLPRIPKDIQINTYPDFMENKRKQSFPSPSSVGSMYRQVKEVCNIHSIWKDELQQEDMKININTDLFFPGFERFVEEAKDDFEYYKSRVNVMLSIYNLENEYELITGCHSGPEEEKKNNDSVETASLEFRHLLQEMRRRFDDGGLSYKKKLRKASAWYHVAYKAGTMLSFGWIMNRLLSDVMEKKQIAQEEHQALKRIGQSFCDKGHQNQIRHWASLYLIQNNDDGHLSDVEKVGDQCLKLIDYFNESESGNQLAHKLLLCLHQTAVTGLPNN